MRGPQPSGARLEKGRETRLEILSRWGRNLVAHELFLPYRSVRLVGWGGIRGGSLGDHVEGSSRLWRVRQEL